MGNNRVKLGDFGVAGMVKSEEMNRNDMFKTVAGTRVFMAPEVFEKIYSFVADVYSLGVTAVQMAEGNPSTSLSQRCWTKEFISFVDMCTLSKEKRPQLSQIKQVSGIE